MAQPQDRRKTHIYHHTAFSHVPTLPSTDQNDTSQTFIKYKHPIHPSFPCTFPCQVTFFSLSAPMVRSNRRLIKTTHHHHKQVTQVLHRFSFSFTSFTSTPTCLSSASKVAAEEHRTNAITRRKRKKMTPLGIEGMLALLLQPLVWLRCALVGTALHGESLSVVKQTR